MLKTLCLIYWKLIVFQETPENTPYSRFLMGISVLLLILVMMTQWILSDLDFTNDLLTTACISTTLVLSYIIYTYAILYFKRLRSRLVQTITCLCNSHTIIHLLASPLFLIDSYLVQANIKKPLILFFAVIYLFITLALSVWEFVVSAYIYKNALNITTVQSVLAAFGLIAVNVLTISFWR